MRLGHPLGACHCPVWVDACVPHRIKDRVQQQRGPPAAAAFDTSSTRFDVPHAQHGNILDLEPWAADSLAVANRVTRPGAPKFASAHVGRDRSAWQRLPDTESSHHAHDEAATKSSAGERWPLQAGFGDRDQLRCATRCMSACACAHFERVSSTTPAPQQLHM